MNIYFWTEKPLLSYSEIVAMATAEGYSWTNTLTELNTNPVAYYNSLNSGGYLTIHDEQSMIFKSVPFINGIESGNTKYISGICYYNQEWTLGDHLR